MKGYVKIVVLIIIFAILLVAVLSISRKRTTIEREPRLSQTMAMFPDLEIDRVFRISINSLQNESLLLRKQAGVWQVAPGKDVLGEIMQQSETREETESEEAEEETTEESEPEAEEEPAEVEEEVEETQEAEESEEPVDPRNDPGPSGDAFRTFFKADSSKVETMLDTIADLPQGQLVTEDSSKHSTLGVLNAIVGIEVTLYDDQMNELAALVIGNQGAAFSTTYVRKPEEDAIYEVPGALQMTFGTRLINMRDREIFQSPPETITSVQIDDRANGFITALSRSEGAWISTDSEGNTLELDAEKVDNLLQQLGTLNAMSYVDRSEPPRPRPEDETFDENDPYGLMEPLAVIQFTTTDNVTHTLHVGRLESSAYYCAADGNLGDVFKVSNTTINAIRAEPESLVFVEGEQEPPEGVAALPSDIVETAEIDTIEAEVGHVPAEGTE